MKNKYANLKKEQYKKLFGVEQYTFFKMHEALQIAFCFEHAQGGKPPKISVFERLCIFLCYYREYRTMEHIAFDFGTDKARISRIIRWVEDILKSHSSFTLPPKSELQELEDEDLVVDVTEHPVKRLKRGKKSGIQARKRGIQPRRKLSQVVALKKFTVQQTRRAKCTILHCSSVLSAVSSGQYACGSIRDMSDCQNFTQTVFCRRKALKNSR